MQSPIIKHLHIVFDDERYDSIAQALLEENQSSYAAVSILERMYRLTVMENNKKCVQFEQSYQYCNCEMQEHFLE